MPSKMPASAAEGVAMPGHLRLPSRFMLHHVLRWRWHFGALFALIVVAAGCGVAQQYVMKLLVDGMAGPRELSGWVTLSLAFSSVSSRRNRSSTASRDG